MRVLISACVLLEGLLFNGYSDVPKDEKYKVSYLSKENNIYVNDVHSTSIDCFLL